MNIFKKFFSDKNSHIKEEFPETELKPLPIELNAVEHKKVPRSLGRLERLYQSKLRGNTSPEIDLEIEKYKNLIAAEGIIPPENISEVETLKKLLG